MPKQFEPKLVVDLATLTGSAVAALGGEAAALMTSCDQEVTATLMESANTVDERLVEFPLWACYGTSLKSDIADQKNVGSREAGLIIAGKFLEKYIDYPWMHIDIAGPSFNHQTKTIEEKEDRGMAYACSWSFLNLGANATSKKPLRVGLTLGDPGGIGPDLVLHALMHRHFRKRVKFTVFGSESILKKRIKTLTR